MWRDWEVGDELFQFELPYPAESLTDVYNMAIFPNIPLPSMLTLYLFDSHYLNSFLYLLHKWLVKKKSVVFACLSLCLFSFPKRPTGVLYLFIFYFGIESGWMTRYLIYRSWLTTFYFLQNFVASVLFIILFLNTSWGKSDATLNFLLIPTLSSLRASQ